MLMKHRILAQLVVLASLLELIAGYAFPTPILFRKHTALIMKRSNMLRGPKMQQDDFAGSNGITPLSELIPTLPAISYPKEQRIRLAELLQRTSLNEVLFQKVDELRNDLISKYLYKSQEPMKQPAQKPTLVVIGSGWAAESIAQTIDNTKFEVIFISPRSFFIFTPMLASAAVGTVEYRSITEPVRSTNPNIKYFLAAATDIDPEKKLVYCTSQARESSQFRRFSFP